MVIKTAKRAALLSALFALIINTGCGSSSDSTPPPPPPPPPPPTVIGSTTVSGTIQYQDREYDALDFTGTLSTKAVRYALVEVVDSTTDTVFASTTTDSLGAYSMTFSFTSSIIYVRVISEAVLSPTSVIDVGGYSSLYAVGSADQSVSDGVPLTVNMVIPATSTGFAVGGIFNMLDVFTIGAEFIKAHQGAYPDGLLDIYWEQGSCDGTYYWPGNGIFVLGGCGGDTDEYDDDVLWHEYGHYVADKYSMDQSPGGSHSFLDNDQDLRLSWSEGWGNFFPGAVKTWLSSTTPALLSATGMLLSGYVDTVNSATGISFDFGNPGGSPYVYSSSEVAVANVLWRAMSEMGGGMARIWDVFTNYIPSPTYFPNAPVNLETFWDGWVIRQASTSASLLSILNFRQIKYQEDAYETEESAGVRKVTIGASEAHTLYKSNGLADTDRIAFDAIVGGSYTIQTSDLSNGADTYITIFGPTGSQVAANDNWNGQVYPLDTGRYDIYDEYIYPPNDGTTLSSKQSFTAQTSGTYQVEVKTSPNKSNSAGRYGTYTLTVTGP